MGRTEDTESTEVFELRDRSGFLSPVPAITTRLRRKDSQHSVNPVIPSVPSPPPSPPSPPRETVPVPVVAAARRAAGPAANRNPNMGMLHDESPILGSVTFRARRPACDGYPRARTLRTKPFPSPPPSPPSPPRETLPFPKPSVLSVSSVRNLPPQNPLR